MANKRLILFIIFMMSTNSFAKEGFSSCLKNSDCVVVEDACHFTDAINKKHLKDYKKWVKAEGMTIQCPELYGPGTKGFKAICEKNRCKHVKAKKSK